eukprot:jgi/Botrbrau1/6012/Bobra.104_1s0039.1
MAATALTSISTPKLAVRPRRMSVAVKSQVIASSTKLAVPPVMRDFRRAALGVAAGLLLSVAPAYAAANLALGEEVFEGNCAACHAGGGNSVQPNRTLAKADLESYLEGGYNETAIIYQVTNGKNAMPAWGDRLSEEEIESVAAYVFKTADAGW